MWLAIGILLLLIGEIAIFRSEVWGVYWYWAWFLVRPQETWLGLGGIIPMERIFAVTLIAWIFYRYRISNRRPIVLATPIKMFAVLVLVNFLTVPTALWVGNSWGYSVQFLKLFLFFWVASIVLTTPKRMIGFVWVYIIGIGWEAFSAIRNYYTNPYFAQGIQRAEGSTATWSDPNATAFNLVFAFPIILAVLFASDKWKLRIPIIAIAVMSTVALILTGSRAGFVDLILTFLVMTLRAKRRFILLPGLVVLASVVWILTPQQYKERYETLLGFAEDPTANLDTSQGESAYGRYVGFRVGMMMFADHPILGVGVGNFPFAWRYGPYVFEGYKGWHQPHNLPGQILSEQGIVGAISFITFVVVIFRSNALGLRMLSRLKKPPPILMALAKMVPVVLTCMAISSFSSHSYYRYNWYFMCLLSAFVLEASGRARRRSIFNRPRNGSASEDSQACEKGKVQEEKEKMGIGPL